jgi:hypothetical protein
MKVCLINFIHINYCVFHQFILLRHVQIYFHKCILAISIYMYVWKKYQNFAKLGKSKRMEQKHLI